MLNNLDELKNIADVIAAQFGSNTEVVVHDFTGDLDHTIVYIVNGHVTGRAVGGCPTKLFLQFANHEITPKSKIRHITRNADGKTLRSSTVNFYGEHQRLLGALCINQDISDLLLLEKAAKGLSDSKCFETSVLSTDNELYSTSIHGLLDGIIAEGIALIGTPPSEMNKEAKIKFLAFLDERGVFLIQKSGQRLCELLNISKFTLYKYLEEARES